MTKKVYPATKALEHYDADFFNWTMGKLLQLSGETFDGSKFTIDGKPISGEDLIKLLMFGN